MSLARLRQFGAFDVERETAYHALITPDVSRGVRIPWLSCCAAQQCDVAMKAFAMSQCGQFPPLAALVALLFERRFSIRDLPSSP